MRRFAVLVGILGLLGLFVVPAVAQKPAAGRDPAPEEERMAGMMTTMGKMQEQIKDMQEQMKQMTGMQGMGPMQGRLGNMTAMMEQMKGMMAQHHEQMMKQCPGMATPPPSKQGG